MSSELRVNKLTSRSGVGTVTFNDSGLIITGIATAATLDITGNATIAGVLSYDDVTNVDSVGLITARSGLRVVGTASSIGVGVANPAEKIDVAGSIQSDTGLKVAGHPVVGYGNLGGGEYAARLGSTGSSTLNKTQIYARGAHVATFDGASGNVGVGTDDPRYPLEVYNSNALVSGSSAGTLILEDRGVADGARPFALLASNGGNFTFTNSNRNASGTTTSSVERLRIKSDGDVYIGNIAHSNDGGANSSYRTLTLTDTTNGAQLHLRGQSPKLFLDVTSGGNGEIYYDSGDLRILSGEPGTTSSEKLRIDSSGRLLIGTTAGASGRIVHASNSGSNSAYFHSTNGSTGTGSQDGIVMGMGDATNAYFWNYESGNIQFATSATARVTIDSSGRLLVNTTSASGDNKLQVASSDVSIYGITVGRGAGAVLSNTALGTNALDANTSGANNIAIGYDALGANTIGGTNVAIGNYALDANTSGSDNTAVGLHALGGNTTAAYNTAVGRRCMFANTTGANNTAIGANALEVNTTGNYIVAIGYNALSSDVTPEESTAVGYQALTSQTSGRNHAFGFRAGQDLTTGSYNTLMGGECGENLTTGNYNTAIGLQALRFTTTGSQNVVVGSRALDTNTTGNNNIAIGHDALTGNTGGDGNIAIGSNCLLSNTGGDGSTAVGFKAMESNTTSGNTAFGYYALRLNTSSQYCVAVGYAALEKSTSVNNTALGHNAGVNITTGNSNTAIGAFAMDACQTPSDGTAVGHNCLGNLTTGQANTAVGRRCAEALTTGNYNTFYGTYAGLVQTTGNYNVLLGYRSGDNLTTGNGNLCVGYFARTYNASTDTSIVIGKDINGVGGSGYVTIGMNSTSDKIYNNFQSNATWTRNSDVRLKKDIATNTNCGLDFINDLRTVTYKWRAPSELDQTMSEYNPEKTEASYTGKMYGFIAQEVKQALDDHNITDFGGWTTDNSEDDLQGISYEMFVMPLVKAVQELSAKNAALEARIAALEG